MLMKTNCKDTLDDKVVELFQGYLVRFTKCCSEFFGFGGLRVLESFARERQSSDEPHQTFGSSSLLLALLVLDE